VNAEGLVFVQAERKNSALFIELLEKLRQMHPDAKRIHLVPGNYVIHSSRVVQKYLRESQALFELHFLPPYSPDDNRIERLWREVHANVTRNHRCRSIEDLMKKVTWYLHRQARKLKAKQGAVTLKRHRRRVAA